MLNKGFIVLMLFHLDNILLYGDFLLADYLNACSIPELSLGQMF